MKRPYDFAIVGAGIVGLSVANELLKRHPRSTIVIIEKEEAPGVHASGRNSGVLHSGIFYANDTLKARVCSEGNRRMIDFATEEGVKFAKSGKVILATTEEQVPTVDKLLKNAQDSNISAEKIDNQQLREVEPFANPDALGAIYCKTTAVIDSKGVVERLYQKLKDCGVVFVFNAKLTKKIRNGEVETSKGRIRYSFLYNCSGAYSDQVAKLFDLADRYALVPFKGIYWKLSNNFESKIRANIYPVPDISLPFLGVHFTKVADGNVYIGPTAIPVFGRENYSALHGIKIPEALSISMELSKMYFKNQNNFRKMTHIEMSKYWKSTFLSEAQRLVPSLNKEDMLPTSKSGIRPQLVNTDTGQLEMDYVLESTEDSMHVLNAISPAFTSAFAFAELIVDKAEKI